MAHSTATIVVGPGDATPVRITDDLEFGARIAVDFKHGETTVAKLLWNNGQNDGPIDTVNAFKQWLDMLAAEVADTLNDRLHGVGEKTEPF